MATDVVIVVPAFGRPDELRGCLDALAVQDGGPYRTVVVDDGSPEPLAQACTGYGEWLTILRQENAGPARARNHGARATASSFLCFTDDDCRPHEGWVRALRAAHAGNARALVGGRIENAFAENPFSAASQDLSDWIRTVQERRAGGPDYFLSCNLGCARAGFERLGGFDESFPLAAGEDRQFGMAWKREVGALVYADDAVVEHRHFHTLRKFWRQHRNYGRGARHLRVAAPATAGGRRFERAGFYAGLVLHPLADRSLTPFRRVERTALMGLTQAAMISGYFAPGHRGRARAANDAGGHEGDEAPGAGRRRRGSSRPRM